MKETYENSQPTNKPALKEMVKEVLQAEGK